MPRTVQYGCTRRPSGSGRDTHATARAPTLVEVNAPHAGGPGGIRTHDQGIMSPLLSPLSYGPLVAHAAIDALSTRQSAGDDPRSRQIRSSGGETRTLNRTVNSRVLCQLSYPGKRRQSRGHDHARPPPTLVRRDSTSHANGVRVSRKSSNAVNRPTAGRQPTQTTTPPSTNPANTSPG